MELGGDQAGLCKDELVKALSDDNVDVIEAVIPQLASIMKILVKMQVVSPDSNVIFNNSLCFNHKLVLTLLKRWFCRLRRFLKSVASSFSVRNV